MQSIDNNIMSCLTMQSFAVVCSYDRCTMMHSRIRHSRSSGEMRDARCEMLQVPRATEAEGKVEIQSATRTKWFGWGDGQAKDPECHAR